jgi:hypothetical protein
MNETRTSRYHKTLTWQCLPWRGQAPADRFGRTDGDTRRAGHFASEPRINDQIPAAEIRLVRPDGEQIGILGLTGQLS